MSTRFKISNIFTHISFSQFADVMRDVQSCVDEIGKKAVLRRETDINLMTSAVWYSTFWNEGDKELYESERASKSIQRVKKVDALLSHNWPRTKYVEGSFKLKGGNDDYGNLWVNAKYDREKDPRALTFYTQGDGHPEFVNLLAQRRRLKLTGF